MLHINVYLTLWCGSLFSFIVFKPAIDKIDAGAKVNTLFKLLCCVICTLGWF